MHVFVWHWGLSVHESPANLVPVISEIAHAKMSWVGGGDATAKRRHVVAPPQSEATQHVSRHDFGEPVQSPDRHSSFTAHEEPADFPPVAGAERCASVAGTQ